MGETARILANLATEGCASEWGRARLLGEIEAPNWRLLDGDESNWTYLIPVEVEELWPLLPPEARLAVYLVAKAAAGERHEARSYHID
jgi:hypothetical protein